MRWRNDSKSSFEEDDRSMMLLTSRPQRRCGKLRAVSYSTRCATQIIIASRHTSDRGRSSTEDFVSRITITSASRNSLTRRGRWRSTCSSCIGMVRRSGKLCSGVMLRLMRTKRSQELILRRYLVYDNGDDCYSPTELCAVGLHHG